MLLHTQRCKSGVDTLYAGGMGSREDGVSGSRGFLSFPCFFVLHLGYAYRVRVHGKDFVSRSCMVTQRAGSSLS